MEELLETLVFQKGGTVIIGPIRLSEGYNSPFLSPAM